ncbi:MAG: hypothetical protein KKF20_01145, partial [Bacteroidetes bacterium]|nr:hypothetical protein [Bacteroidota bacterium]
SQDLNIVGGTANIRSIKYSDGIATVNDTTQVLSLSTHNAFGATEFDQGDITSFVSRGEVPSTHISSIISVMHLLHSNMT